MAEIFRDIPDPRKGNARKHKLEEILTIAMLAIISECTQFTEMELFGKERGEWLRGFLTLEMGIDISGAEGALWIRQGNMKGR